MRLVSVPLVVVLGTSTACGRIEVEDVRVAEPTGAVGPAGAVDAAPVPLPAEVGLPDVEMVEPDAPAPTRSPRTLWARRLDGADLESTVEATALLADGEGAYLGGAFSGTALFTLPGTWAVPVKDRAPYVLRVDGTGKVVDGARYVAGGDGPDSLYDVAPTGLAASPTGDVFFAGQVTTGWIDVGSQRISAPPAGGLVSHGFVARTSLHWDVAWTLDAGIGGRGSVPTVVARNTCDLVVATERLVDATSGKSLHTITAYSPTGVRRWEYEFEAFDNGAGVVMLAQSASCSIAFAPRFGQVTLEGSRIGDDTTWSVTGVLEKTGTLRWASALPARFVATGIAVADDESVGVTGVHGCSGYHCVAGGGAAEFSAVGTLRFDVFMPGDGQTAFAGTEMIAAGPYSGGPRPLGGTVLPAGRDIYVAGISPTGAIDWAAAYGSDHFEQPVALVAATDGTLLIAGTAYGASIDLGTGPLPGRWGAAYVAKIAPP